MASSVASSATAALPPPVAMDDSAVLFEQLCAKSAMDFAQTKLLDDPAVRAVRSKVVQLTGHANLLTYDSRSEIRFIGRPPTEGMIGAALQAARQACVSGSPQQIEQALEGAADILEQVQALKQAIAALHPAAPRVIDGPFSHGFGQKFHEARESQQIRWTSHLDDIEKSIRSTGVLVATRHALNEVSTTPARAKLAGELLRSDNIVQLLTTAERRDFTMLLLSAMSADVKPKVSPGELSARMVLSNRGGVARADKALEALADPRLAYLSASEQTTAVAFLLQTMRGYVSTLETHTSWKAAEAARLFGNAPKEIILGKVDHKFLAAVKHECKGAMDAASLEVPPHESGKLQERLSHFKALAIHYDNIVTLESLGENKSKSVAKYRDLAAKARGNAAVAKQHIQYAREMSAYL